MNTRRLSLCTGLATAATVCSGALAAPLAQATENAYGHHVIDIDSIVEALSPHGEVRTTATEFLDGHVRVQIHGSVTNEANQLRVPPGVNCVYAHAIFTYADGSTSETKEEPRACEGVVQSRPVDLHSSSSKDVVKYVVQLRGSSSSDVREIGVVKAGSTYLIGDAPDSLGTAAQLDTDRIRLTKPTSTGVTRTLFEGTSKYSVTKTVLPTVGTYWNVTSTVEGDLYWWDVIDGDSAYVKIEWTYTDDTKSHKNVGPFKRTKEGTKVHLAPQTSRWDKDVESVRVSVTSAGGADQGFASITAFGDYLSP